MKTVTRLICASVALTILLACSKMAITQCATPTLDPPSKTGPAGQDIKVTIETKTLGASLSWSDDPSQPPTPTGPHIITAPKGDAITVFGRTLRAMAFKTGLSNSNIVTGTYVAQ
jgi:hypothetical protein